MEAFNGQATLMAQAAVLAAATDGHLHMPNIVRTWVDINTKDEVSIEEAMRYPIYGEKCSKSVTYRCDLPHTLPGRKEKVGFVNIKYRAAKDTHNSRRCQLPGSKAGYNTPLVHRKEVSKEGGSGPPNNSSSKSARGGSGVAAPPLPPAPPPDAWSKGTLGDIPDFLDHVHDLGGGLLQPIPDHDPIQSHAAALNQAAAAAASAAAAAAAAHGHQRKPSGDGGYPQGGHGHVNMTHDLLGDVRASTIEDINSLKDADLLQQFTDEELKRFWMEVEDTPEMSMEASLGHSGPHSHHESAYMSVSAAASDAAATSSRDVDEWGDVSSAKLPEGEHAWAARPTESQNVCESPSNPKNVTAAAAAAGMHDPRAAALLQTAANMPPVDPAAAAALAESILNSNSAHSPHLGPSSMEWVRAIITLSSELALSREDLILATSKAVMPQENPNRPEPTAMSALPPQAMSMENIANVPGLLLATSREAALARIPDVFQNMPQLVTCALRAHPLGATVQDLYMWVERVDPKLRYKPTRNSSKAAGSSVESATAMSAELGAKRVAGGGAGAGGGGGTTSCSVSAMTGPDADTATEDTGVSSPAVGKSGHTIKPLVEIAHWQSLVRTSLHRGVAGGKFGKRSKTDSDKVLYFIANSAIGLSNAGSLPKAAAEAGLMDPATTAAIAAHAAATPQQPLPTAFALPMPDAGQLNAAAASLFGQWASNPGMAAMMARMGMMGGMPAPAQPPPQMFNPIPNVQPAPEPPAPTGLPIGHSVEEYLPPLKARRTPAEFGGDGAPAPAPAPAPASGGGIPAFLTKGLEEVNRGSREGMIGAGSAENPAPAPAGHIPVMLVGGVGGKPGTKHTHTPEGQPVSDRLEWLVSEREEPDFQWDTAVKEVQHSMAKLSTKGVIPMYSGGAPAAAPQKKGILGAVGGGVRALGRSVGSVIRLSSETVGGAAGIVKRGLSQELHHRKSRGPAPAVSEKDDAASAAARAAEVIAAANAAAAAGGGRPAMPPGQ